MEEKKGMGVFGSIQNEQNNVSGTAQKIELNIVSEESPESIYNLLFNQTGENKN